MNDNPPKKLPRYLREFAPDDTTEIFEGPQIVNCVGVGGQREHCFLAADGFDECVGCHKIACTTCQVKESGTVYCLPCHAERMFVPNLGNDNARQVSTMREELASEWDVENVGELTVEEVEGLYEKKEIASARIKQLQKDVPFPLYPSKLIDSDNPLKWTTVTDIDLGEGGSFLLDNNLDQKYLPRILGLFSELVRFQFDKKGTDDNVKDHKVYRCVPKMFIDFAEKARLDSGFRLIARCIRHSYDSRTHPIHECCVARIVVDRNGEVGLLLSHRVPARSLHRCGAIYTARVLCGQNKMFSAANAHAKLVLKMRSGLSAFIHLFHLTN